MRKGRGRGGMKKDGKGKGRGLSQAMHLASMSPPGEKRKGAPSYPSIQGHTQRWERGCAKVPVVLNLLFVKESQPSCCGPVAHSCLVTFSIVSWFILLQLSRCCVLLCCLFCFALFALLRARVGFLCAFSPPAFPSFILPACCVLSCLFPAFVVFPLVSPLFVVAGCPCSLPPSLPPLVCETPNKTKPGISARIRLILTKIWPSSL